MIEIMHNKEYGLFFTINNEDSLIFRYSERYTKKGNLGRELKKFKMDKDSLSFLKDNYKTEFYSCDDFVSINLDMEFIDAVMADGIVPKENLNKMKETSKDLLAFPLLLKYFKVTPISFNYDFHISMVIRPFKEITKIKLNNVAENRTVLTFHFENKTGKFLKTYIEHRTDTPKSRYTWNIIHICDYIGNLTICA